MSSIDSCHSIAYFSVGGMTCGACTSAVNNALENIKGIKEVSVNLMTENCKVKFDNSFINAEQIKQAIEDCGFDAEVKSDVSIKDSHKKDQIFRLKVMGMTCSACSNSVETALRSVDGVESAVVALTTESARIVANNSVGIRTLIETIEDAGFDALPEESTDNAAQIAALTRVKEIQKARSDTIKCVLANIPIMLCMDMASHRIEFLEFLHVNITGSLYLNDIISFIFATPLQFGIGGQYYRRAYSAIKHGAPNMDVLVAISTTCAYLFSVISWLHAVIYLADGSRPLTLWETSSMVIAFVTLGKYLENKAKGQTSIAISKLISLVPSTTCIYADSSLFYRKFMTEKDDDDLCGSTETIVESTIELKTISTELLQPDDIVLLRPGEKIPADGVILRGESFVSEAHITGESFPLHKNVGDLVVGGSVNGSGQLDFKVLRAGQNTKLAQIVRLVQDAQTSKAPVQRFADMVSGFFVPIVLVLALCTFVFWMCIIGILKKMPSAFADDQGPFLLCLRLCISVVVVACPCALGLATPTAVMVASGVAAENGILLRGGAIIEVASGVDTVVFDKTGTLTMGQHEVVEFSFSDKWSNVLWHILREFESFSEHPVAKGLVRKGEENRTKHDPDVICENFQAIVGKGAMAEFYLPEDGQIRRIIAGSRELLAEHDIIADELKELDIAAGLTVVYIGIDDEYVGKVLLSDKIRPEAAEAVAAVKSLGIRVAMLTGDSEAVATKVAKEVGISEDLVWAAISPSGKMQVVNQLRNGNYGKINPDISQFEIEEETIGTDQASRGPAAHRVAMVGDGINDSPALTAADLGVSISGATQAAIEAADVVLIKDVKPLMDVANVFDLSRRAYTRIRVNLFCSMIYNILMIPIAMGLLLPFGIWLHPMMASAAMAASSLSVLFSSLLLQLWKPLTTKPKQSPTSWLKRLLRQSYEPLAQV